MTSFQLLLYFTVDQLKVWGHIDILSVFNDKLLVSRYNLSRLFIYSRDGRHLSTISTNDNDNLFDATWTPHGNIVYTTFMSKKVVVMSESGKVITINTQMTDPRCLSVSNDDVIYLAEWDKGVYQSTDDGVTWSFVFKSTVKWHCMQVIKVTTDHSDIFWTLEDNDNDKYRLRVYSLDKRHFLGKVKWKDIAVPNIDNEPINLLRSVLSEDGNMNIFLSDNENNAVQMFSVNGQYHCQLLTSHHIRNAPYRLAVDKERQLLYVGQEESVVGVFKLSYGNEGY